MSNQHVQLPNDNPNSEELTPKDLLIYICIKKFYNSKTNECFPSLDTIVKLSGVSKPTVRKSIENLKKFGYITVTIKGRSNYYHFNPYKKFEIFSPEFIESDLDPNLKAYIVVTQNLMFKDQEGIGKMSYTDSELSKKINLDKRTIAKYNQILKEKGLLTELPVKNNEGITINQKFFHLDELGQSIIWTLQKHDNDIKELSQKAESNEKDLKKVLKKLDETNKVVQTMEAIIKKYGLNINDELNNQNEIII